MKGNNVLRDILMM